MIKLAPNAVEHINSCIPPKHHLRVGIKSGGCSGFEYRLAFEETEAIDKEKDSFYEQDSIVVVVDKKSAILLDDVTLDYVDGLMGAGFTFINPSAVKTCGCGQSFQ